MTKTKIKNKIGRPTKYKGEATLKLAKEYIQECIDEYKDKRLIVKLPKAEGLALKLDIPREKLYEWAKKHEEFRYILDTINKLQVERLIDKGLSNDYNPTIAKLVLAKHGYSDKSEVDHKSSDLVDVLKSILGRPESLVKDNDTVNSGGYQKEFIE